MAAVHNNNNKDSQQQQQRNGTTSPSGWHFPKSGLGTPELFYSFSGGGGASSSNSNHNHHQQQQQHNNGPMASSSSNSNAVPSGSSSGGQPAWFKPQGKKETGQVASSSSSAGIIKKEEPDIDDGDDAHYGNAGESSNTGNQTRQVKDNTGNEEANRNVRALSDPPVRQSPAWIFPAAGFGPHKTHLEQEPNPFEHSFSSRPEENAAHLQFAQAINAGNNGHAATGASVHAGQGYNAGYPSNSYMNAGQVGGGGPSATGSNNNNQYEIGPSRRARSQSPKSAGWQHSSLNPQRSMNSHFNSAFPGDNSGYLGSNLFGGGNNGKGNAFGNISTPSSELPSFGWTFDGSGHSHGHHSHANQGGAGPSNLSGASNNNGIFDPTSIRTGLTPGVSDAKHNNPPHSPATQALFAMMTNATPGGDIGAHFGSSSSNAGPSKGVQQAHPSNSSLHTAGGLHPNPTALGDVSRASSNSSNSSASQVQHGHNSNNVHPQGVYSQALPRPLPQQGPYTQQQQLHSSYQGGNPTGYLQQSLPRPFPPRAFDSAQNSEAGSSQTVPQLPLQQQQRQGDHNPLYLLSQQAQDGQGVPPHLQHQQHHPSGLPPNAVHRLAPPQGLHSRHPSDTQPGVPSSSHNEDAMLAAAALSGLSTPRPAYVGGPSPLATVNPGSITTSVPTLVQPPAGRVKPIPPPANLFHEQKPPSALTKENMKANNARGGSAAAAASSKKGGANKRKKGNTATPEPSNAGDDSKSKIRRTSRRTTTTNAIASTSQQQFAPDQQSPDNQLDEIEQRYLPGGGDAAGMGLHDDMGDSDDDDMMSNNGSFNGSREGMGGSQAGDGSNVSPPRKGGRGPKQHFATEEEKRKNFLERNRQAALKCRQRKKQWLGSLQSKVEYLTADNETLHTTVRRLREEAASLRAILGAHSDCQLSLPSGPGGPGGVTTVGAYLHGVQQQQQGPPPPQQRQY